MTRPPAARPPITRIVRRERSVFLERRSFMALASGMALAGCGLAAAAAVEAQGPQRARPVQIEAQLVGTALTDFARALPGLAAGQMLVLRQVAEADGEARFEVYAAEGPSAGARLGYVTGQKAEAAAVLASHGRKLSARLVALDPSRWDGARIQLAAR